MNNKFNNWTVLFLLTFFTMNAHAQTTGKPIWKNKSFALYKDKVVQENKFTGKALSATELQSDYKSPTNEFQSPAISFKFSINGKDNEMKPGVNHSINCIGDNNNCETPIIKFGQASIDTRAVPDNTYLRPKTKMKIRLDMSEVLQAFEKEGFYTTFKGDKIYKQDFKGVFVAGNTNPLNWDFDNLANNPDLQLKDNDKDGIYETTLTLNDQKDEKQTSSSWKASKKLTAFPTYKSEYPLADALYHLAIEEMDNAVEPDSTFRTGKEWAGVWTRDISYSIILSMAHLQPAVAKYSLLRKVKNGKIIQDTGTGGAYPNSTDRIIWATAAWELYKATGDEAWLTQAYHIIKNSLEDDLKNAFDKKTGMFKGESSFLDWREQTYPKWMQPVDIYESECLGTNAAFYQANIVLSEMATLLKDPAAATKYKQVAASVKAGINKHLWLPSKGYYAQYLYGRNSKITSPRAEALGESLSVLFGIADGERAKEVIRRTPVMDYGIPCIYPQIPNIPPYHNNAVWPFVQSYYALAAAKAGNEEAVLASIAAIYRPAALWVTNKENFVASNGDFAGTVINSSNMLWSLSGSISLIHKIIFGINMNADGLHFRPFVPNQLKGKRSLTNFRYRNAILDIEMEGYGNQVKSFIIDGKPTAPSIAGSLNGRHSIKIILANNTISDKTINTVDHYITLDAPTLSINNKSISWNKMSGASKYKVLKNGKELMTTTKSNVAVPQSGFAEYQVIAIDAKGIPSFASEPVIVAGKNSITNYEMESISEKSKENYKGFSGNGFVEVSTTKNKTLTIPVTIPSDGLYSIDFKYANGNGPTNTENKCAIRTVRLADKKIGTLVLPQRGRDEWSNWGWSNIIKVPLTKGKHNISISLEPHNENMNGEINQAMLDMMRVIKM